MKALRAHYDYAEAYSEDDGEVRIAVICKMDAPRVRHLTLHDLREEHGEDERDIASEALAEIQRYPWVDANCGLPSRPDVGSDDPDLLSDVEEFIRSHVELPEPEYYTVCASWVIATYTLREYTNAPRLILHGPTHSGKTRTIDTLKLLCYRGLVFIDPTGPALFRTIEKYRPTILIDEGQQQFDKHVKNPLHSTFVAGFDSGRRIPRVVGGMDGDYDVDYFEPYCFMVLSMTRLPPADWQNRSIVINMQERTDPGLNRRIDFDNAKKLRGRLLALRLKILSGQTDLARFKEMAALASQASWTDSSGDEAYLGDRAADIARCLLAPGFMFGGHKEIFAAISKSQATAVSELRETLDAKVFFALQETVRKRQGAALGQTICPDTSRISTRDVKDQLNTDLKHQGDAGFREVPTRTVTSILRTLGFEFRPGAHNQSFFVMGDKTRKAWTIYLKKYGPRGVTTS